MHFPRQVTLRTWAKNNNCVSVNYGPLTFSAQIQENWQPYGNNPAPWTEFEAYPATPWNYGFGPQHRGSFRFVHSCDQRQRRGNQSVFSRQLPH